MTSEPTLALAVEPFNVRQALVAQSLDDADDATLDYLHFFTENVPTAGAFFMHAVPRLNFFNSPEEMGEDVLSQGDFAIRQERIAGMKSNVAAHFPHSKKMSVEYDVREGDPLVKMATAQMERFSFGEDIMKYSDENKGDLLVMGARGHSKVHLLLIGSVTEKVLSLTKRTPVLVVKG